MHTGFSLGCNCTCTELSLAPVPVFSANEPSWLSMSQDCCPKLMWWHAKLVMKGSQLLGMPSMAAMAENHMA